MQADHGDYYSPMFGLYQQPTAIPLDLQGQVHYYRKVNNCHHFHHLLKTGDNHHHQFLL